MAIMPDPNSVVALALSGALPDVQAGAILAAAFAPAKPRPNGCYNRPPVTAGQVTHVAQDGWTDIRDGFGNPVRVPRYIDIKHANSTDCDYSRTTPDPRCSGCIHNEGVV